MTVIELHRRIDHLRSTLDQLEQELEAVDHGLEELDAAPRTPLPPPAHRSQAPRQGAGFEGTPLAIAAG